MKIKIWIGVSLAVTIGVAGCDMDSRDTGDKKVESSNVTVMKSKFGTTEGREVSLYTLTNMNGIVVRVTNYGAIITHILTPDRNGVSGDIVLGFDSLEPYLKGHPYFGCIAGRYANRIARGKFTLDGRDYSLAVNNGPNHLHGGIRGFDKKVWDAEEIRDSTGAGVLLTLSSPDGDEGYPGNLKVKVAYVLTDQDELRCLITAETDKPTPVNLCNHTYFNLNGAKTSILNHLLEIFADNYTEVDENLIPTGILPVVTNTSMDFTTSFPIGGRIDKVKGGYDHNYVLRKKPGELIPAARLTDPFSGRIVEILTTQPGVQFYSGNFLDGSVTGKGGTVYGKHWGLCLETQHFPDSPNQKNFPNTILRPGETYRQETVFRFLN